MPRLPEHRNPDRNPAARAPYNFVPLPERVVTAAEDANDLPDHSTYASEGYANTGYLDVTLSTRSPLYVRGPLSLDHFTLREKGRDVNGAEATPSTRYVDRLENTPWFFYRGGTAQPVIPGSSLRGMLRALVEIVSFGKVSWVTDRRLFFRTVDDTALGKYYNERTMEEVGRAPAGMSRAAPVYRPRVRGGFLKQRSNGAYYIEECTVVRIEVNDLLGVFRLNDRRELYELNGRPLNPGNDNPNQTPIWKYQHKSLWADVDAQEHDYPFEARSDDRGRHIHPDLCLRMRRATNPSLTGSGRKQEGTMVLTGHMQRKHMAFLFVPTPGTPRTFEVPNDPDEEDPNRRLLDRFHDDDQMTRWQRLAFPKGAPSGTDRQRDGYLATGDPIFFLTDHGGYGSNVEFFGRAQMFRLPYTQTPRDVVPEDLRRPEIVDFADALFGYVRTRQELEEMRARGVTVGTQGDKRRAYAGRVFVTDAVVTESPNGLWLSEEPMTPPILTTPKPTAFQHYLTQQQPDDRKRLDHYDSPPLLPTTLRGAKLYWHRGNPDVRQLHKPPQDPTSTQHTQIKPVRAGVTFTFRVYFENLSPQELGALVWVLELPGEVGVPYCHKLGMGKPLGMGSVALSSRLHRTDRVQRYQRLLDGDAWATGASPADTAPFIQQFEQHVLQELGLQHQHLRDHPRIQDLLALLQWREADAQWLDETRYLMVQHPRNGNEYRGRPVLPTPRTVASQRPASSSRQPSAPPGRRPQQLDQPGRGPQRPEERHAALPPNRGKQPRQGPVREPRQESTSGAVRQQRPEPPRGPNRFDAPPQSHGRGRVRPTTGEEEVTLAAKVRHDQSAMVSTGDGHRVLCTQLKNYPLLSRGDRFIARVTREDGQPVSATFHRRLDS